MTTRRLLWIMIGVFSATIVAVGAGTAALLLFVQLGRQGEQILVMGGDSRMVLLGERGERLMAEDYNRSLSYPALSPDGSRVAYVGQDDEGSTLYSLHLRTGERTSLYSSSESQPFYMTWSPDGRRISFLSGQADGTLAVRVIAADGSQVSELLGSTTRSSYFAWKPDSSALLLHIGGASFEQGRVAAYEPGRAEPIQELADPGLFNTPAWSADGSQFFYVAQPEIAGMPTPEMVESVLTSVARDGATQVLASEKMAAMLFARAPASDDIAYITFGPAGFGPLKLVGEGGARVISREEEQIPAFFWSPDGSQIAYLSIGQGAGSEGRFTWHVVGREGGEIRDLISFVPSRAFIAMVNYFDAYAFSLNMWSAGGDKLVYAADDGVYVLDVPSGEVERRADGAMATWVGPR